MKSRKLEVAVKKGDVSSVIGLIAQFSHITFEKLPMQYQSMMSVEDLIALGTNHAVTNVVKLYRSNKVKEKREFVEGQAYENAQFITYLHVALDNLYKDLLKEVYREKRVAAIYSMDTQVSHKGQKMDMYSCVLRFADKRSVENDIINRIDAVNAFKKVYKQASPKLRRHLINWCIQPKVTKYKLTGSQFKSALREYRKAEFGNILLPEYIRTIQTDAVCRNRVVLSILGVPAKTVDTGVKDSKSRIIYKGGFRTTVRKNQPSLEVQLLTGALV